MKIDCDCDGHVSWDELLTFVMSQNRNISTSELVDSQYLRVETPEPAPGEAHRDTATMAMYTPKVGSYVSAGTDSTLRVWSGGNLEHELTISVSQSSNVGVQAMVLLPGSLAKLVVASGDRVVTFYELNDHAGSPRWSVHGKVQLKDMPISLAAWVHVADDAHCLAVGTDAGTIPIFDAKTLTLMLKDDRLKSEMVRGAIPVKYLTPALILTLTLHRDWVTKLVYEPGLGALVSASLDSNVLVTQLDWPEASVPSAVGGHGKASQELVFADPGHCRNMCTIHAHQKGVTSLVLINIAGRKMCATCSYERHVSIWNIETGDNLKTLEGHRGLLRELAYDPHSHILISLAVDGEIRVWDVGTYTQVQVIRPPNSVDRATSIMFNAHTQALVTTTRRLTLWQHPRKLATDEVLKATLLSPQGHQHPLVGVLYSFQFYLVVTGDESGSICVWDVRSGMQVSVDGAPPGPYIPAAPFLLPTGRRWRPFLLPTRRRWRHGPARPVPGAGVPFRARIEAVVDGARRDRPQARDGRHRRLGAAMELFVGPTAEARLNRDRAVDGGERRRPRLSRQGELLRVGGVEPRHLDVARPASRREAPRAQAAGAQRGHPLRRLLPAHCKTSGLNDEIRRRANGCCGGSAQRRLEQSNGCRQQVYFSNFILGHGSDIHSARRPRT